MSDTADWEALKKKAFERELANDIWKKLKGRELPDTWAINYRKILAQSNSI